MPNLKVGVPDALYVKPFLYGLQSSESPFLLHQDIPGNLAILQNENSPLLKAGCAFLSPIDYARHGGEYRIIPDLCVSSLGKNNSIQLYVNSNVINIRTMAVDVRVTSEIVLGKILLAEKFSNLSGKDDPLLLIPMMPNLRKMLSKADAALLVNFYPHQFELPNVFSLDLAEEWADLTHLPYVHGIWVGREGDLPIEHVKTIRSIHTKSSENIGVSSMQEAVKHNGTEKDYTEYLSSFSFAMSQKEEESLVEFFRICYYYGILKDVPELKYFEIESTGPSSPSIIN